jgi:hypothetical protein
LKNYGEMQRPPVFPNTSRELSHNKSVLELINSTPIQQ